MLRIITAGLLALLTMTANAIDFYTANSLMRDCSGNGRIDFCHGYVLGISSQISCVPKGVNGSPASQLRVIVYRYIYDLPQRWHQDAGKLTADGLKEAFGC